jgi:hypothetical protein
MIEFRHWSLSILQRVNSTELRRPVSIKKPLQRESEIVAQIEDLCFLKLCNYFKGAIIMRAKHLKARIEAYEQHLSLILPPRID